MNPYRLKALEGLLDYLSGLQGGDLKAMMAPPASPEEEMPLGEGEDPKLAIPGGKESLAEELGEEDSPLVDVAKGSDDDMGSDDELDELYKKFRR